MTNHAKTVRIGVRRAFTLLEVMLAVVIIGLGVLGLSAIFAGAASQQVASVRTAEAAAHVARIENLVRDRAGAPASGYGGPGPFAAPAAPGDRVRLAPGANGQYGEGFDIPLSPSVWHPLASYRDISAIGYPSYAIALDPETDPTNQTNGALRAFFLNTAPGIVLYHNPLDATAVNPRPVWHIDANVQLPAVHQHVRFVVGGPTSNGVDNTAGVNADPFFTIVPPLGPVPRLETLAHARIHPGSFRVRFEIARRADPIMPNQPLIVGRRTVEFSDAEFFDDPNIDLNGESFPDDTPAPNTPPTGLTRPHPFQGAPGLNPVIDRDRALLDRMPIPPLDPGLGVPSVAELIEFDITLAPYEWIERIVVEPYEWRSDVLLTLAERVRPLPDGSSLGAAVLMQGPMGGSGRRMGVIVYAAEPLERNRVWIPPETGALNDRLLRVERLSLGYDQARRVHFVSTTDSDDAWMTAPGQILLIAGDPNGNALTTLSDAGADGFVRVREQVRVGTEYRGLLEGSPRSAGTLFVQPEQTTLLGPVDVWALHPVARSLSLENGGSFRIVPLEARVIQLR